jgi:phage terminase small subunit
VNAARLLKRADVQAAIAEFQAKTAASLGIDREKALQLAWDIATADPRELVSHVTLSCCHCHGANHLYQWRDPAEFEQASQQFEALLQHWAAKRGPKGKPPQPPNPGGGYGYKPKAAPHPDCP